MSESTALNTSDLDALESMIEKNTLSSLEWINLFITEDPSRACIYTPSNMATDNQRQKKVPDDYLEQIKELREHLIQKKEETLSALKKINPSATAYQIEPFFTTFKTLSLRVTHVETVSGTEYIIRRLAVSVIPENELGMSARELHVINRWLTFPGITLIGGRYATRKTTHCYSYLKHHLETVGGIGVIVDAPAECIFAAEHLKHAHCIQIDLNTYPDNDRKWDHVNNIIRKSSATIVYAGEISTPEAARFLLQQAYTGRPILANLHGETIQSVIENLISLGEKSGIADYRESLSQVLVGITCQSLSKDNVLIEYLQISEAEKASTKTAGESDIRKAIQGEDPEKDIQTITQAYQEHTKNIRSR